MNNQKGNVLIITLVITLLVIGLVMFSQKGKSVVNNYLSLTPTPIPSPEIVDENSLRIFRSSNMMDFTIDLPAKYNVSERFNQVSITDTNGNEIKISKSGTNHENFKDYIEEFDFRRKLIVLESKSLSIDNLDAQVRIIEFPDEKIKLKLYHIYVDYSVYTLSTTSTSFYDDLDQIAKSFRYTP